MLCLLIALCGYGAWLRPGSALRLTPGAGQGDAALYQAIQHRVAQGQSYYSAAATEHRRRHYPLRPFVAVRPPTLAWTVTLVGGADPALWLLRLLAFATVVATDRGLARAALRRSSRHAAVGVLGFSLAIFSQSALLWWHELWTGMLVLLSLTLRQPGRWRASLLAGLSAVLVREFALLLPVVMAGWAWAERERREAVAWGAVLLVGGAALAGHGWAVASVTGAQDLTSPGWTAAGGWRFVLEAARSGSLLLLLPAWVAALAVPVALFGWAAWPCPLARRATGLLFGWTGTFLLLGRPDNGYWGLLLGPTLTVGLVLGATSLARTR